MAFRRSGRARLRPSLIAHRLARRLALPESRRLARRLTLPESRRLARRLALPDFFGRIELLVGIDAMGQVDHALDVIFFGRERRKIGFSGRRKLLGHADASLRVSLLGRGGLGQENFVGSSDQEAALFLE